MVLKKISILNGKTYPGNHLQLPCIKGKEKAATYFQVLHECLCFFTQGCLLMLIFKKLSQSYSKRHPCDGRSDIQKVFSAASQYLDLTLILVLTP